MNRAYSQLSIKSFTDESREFSGVATTPTADRVGDIVEPDGAVFKLPLPLLWQHQADKPIGEVYAAKVSKAGISIKGRIFKATESQSLIERLAEAWESIKIGLVRGLSIGFTPIEMSHIKETYSYHFLRWDWHELSAVTIPANMEASITAIKSLDYKLLAAAGRKENVVWLGDHHRRACRKSNVIYLKKG